MLFVSCFGKLEPVGQPQEKDKAWFVAGEPQKLLLVKSLISGAYAFDT